MSLYYARCLCVGIETHRLQTCIEYSRIFPSTCVCCTIEPILCKRDFIGNLDLVSCTKILGLWRRKAYFQQFVFHERWLVQGARSMFPLKQTLTPHTQKTMESLVDNGPTIEMTVVCTGNLDPVSGTENRVRWEQSHLTYICHLSP